MTKLARALSLSASVAALALAAGAAQAETVRWARVADALTLDPHSQNEGPTLALLRHVYGTLVSRAVDGSLTPDLATSWEIHPEDPTIWVLHLREGVTFHDGSAFTAEDVVFSYERVLHESSGFRAIHADVVGAEAVDEYTVHVQMSGPSPLYPNNLTNFFIVDKTWAEANDVVAPQNYAAGEENFAVRNTNGTGPYQLVSRDPEVRTVLSVFDGYYGDAPQVTEVIYQPIAEAATRIAALLSGEVDFVQDVPVQDIARLEQTDGIAITTGPENRNIFFAYNATSPTLRSTNVADNPFSHPEIREAMALALDRDAIRQVVMRGQSQPSAAPLPPFVNGWTEEMNAYGAPDYERAAELVRSVYPDGFSVQLDCPNDRYLNDEAICQATVGMLGRIGINVSLNSQTRSLHFPLIENLETDFYLLGWGVPTFDSAYVFNFLVHTREGSYGAYNGGQYSNPEVDAMIEEIATMTDLDERNATIARIWDRVMEDRVFLNVHNQLLAYAVREGINIDVHPENSPTLWTVTID
ncbi:ABC transporter substrate-binding protein [Pararhodobacter aggregans]|uniref:Peptide ABC transporter substrate-binding protein n=1 Tax=Pararhodobacter aggregans TaxID=404875 RepID=A0A2T7UQL4_9RHOB|nr:ABC transporter substrate-binding protein [Pararhodobacter aggregans]PTX01719.1 peptide/nickel transport system substrate-binding protein [Pararhodobacter aggregans]PVE46967.1 peptide ABC transporter substrate-binding protein [Pararhodobacter aggregans]